MGKFIKNLFVIVFYPITIFFKLIIKISDKIITRTYIKKINIEKIDNLDGIEFEEFLYYSLKSIGIKVTKTKPSRDYGADLVINLKNQKIVIQSKLYFNHNVGNSAVQEIATAKSYYNADSGAVITNSYFTKSAYQLANATNIKLIDRNKLKEFLTYNKNQKINFIKDLQTI